LHGSWIGTYTILSSPGNVNKYFSVNIKPDGTVIVDTKFNNDQLIAIGTWSLSGSNLTLNYAYVYSSGTYIPTTQTATAIWDVTGKLTGGLFYNVSPNNGGNGTFILNRIN
jgi:hypothetical protein